jgi:hypothetical protein
VVSLRNSISSFRAALRDCSASFQERLGDSSASVNICLGGTVAYFKVILTDIPPGLEVSLAYGSVSSNVRLSGSGCRSTGSVNDSACGQGPVR